MPGVLSPARRIADFTCADATGSVFDLRETVDELRNTLLLVPIEDLPEIEEPDSFYDHQLVGLTARMPDESVIGEVVAVRHEAQDLLVVRRRVDGEAVAGEALIPFVSAIVPTVDVAGGFLELAPQHRDERAQGVRGVGRLDELGPGVVAVGEQHPSCAGRVQGHAAGGPC